MKSGLLWAAAVATWFGLVGCAADENPVSVNSEPTKSDNPPTTSAQIEPWGFDLSGMDESLSPGDSFYRYANGKWLSSHEIPADRASWGSFAVLSVQAEAQVHDILEQLPDDAADGTSAQKARDYYRAFADADAIEAAGLGPAQPALAAISAAATHEDLLRLMADPELALFSPISIGVSIDDKNPDRYIVRIGQAGLSLPDREYYLNDDAVYRQLREAFVAHIARLFSLLGEDEPEHQAELIATLESQIAERHWPTAKRRDVELTYNLRTREQLPENSGDFPWGSALDEAGLADQTEFLLTEIDAVQALARHFSSVPVSTWIAYLKYHYIVDHAAVLPAAIDQERFEFYGRTLSGQPELRERWKRAVAAVNGALGDAVGELYVEQHFPASYKAKMVELVETLRSAYKQRFHDLSWMSDTTKLAADKKLSTFLPKVGYPDHWKDYSELAVRAGDAFGNVVRAGVWSWRFDLARLGKPTDRSEWFMTPQTVNAYYNSTFNEIVFPAAILQPPFFDPAADPAVNYGGIGAVIGHEMGHGFDDQGAKSDERGVLRTWWLPEDETAFQGLVDKLVAQYGAYEALPGLKLNGALTVGENIGDLGGATVAYAAYRASLEGRPAPVLDGKTGDQRFFLAWAQVWRELRREANLRSLVTSDPHSPGQFRVDGVVRNMDAWYEAFDIQPGDALWLAPEERVHIW